MNTSKIRDHGGNLDAAVAQYGGRKSDWIDLSTGINPVPYPIPEISPASWHTLPDNTANERLQEAARKFWNIPDAAGVLAAPGASSLIARIPDLAARGSVDIPGPTYNEHAAAFVARGWQVCATNPDAQVIVHPNNPDGRFWHCFEPTQRLTIIDESFCDVAPGHSLVNLSTRPGVLILKSFGKFWGLAGLRLGFAIGAPDLIARLADTLGPWPVSGPALRIGAAALSDEGWARETRQRLVKDTDRLDGLMAANDAVIFGGTPLFRLYQVDDAIRWQTRLARHHVWSRVFPYSGNWLRLGLPAPDQWAKLMDAL